MRFIVLLLASVALSQAGLLEMSVGGSESAAPGVTSVRPSSEPEPLYGPADLSQMPGWPVSVSSGLFAPARGVALADFDGDGRQEIIMPANNLVHCWKYDGTPYPGWPATMAGDSCQYAAAVADVDADGEFEVAVSTRGLTAGGAAYLIEENGQISAGWPFRGSNGSFQDAPTLADLDGDDTMEIILLERLASSAKVHVLEPDGRSFGPGWPVTLDHVPAAGCGVADINMDGMKEIVAFSYNSIYVYHPDGTLLPGWPRQVSGANFSYQSPALADIDGDDSLEIVTAMHRDAPGCYVWRHDGTMQPGWPRSFSGWSYCPPSVADLYRDGGLKMVCGQAGGGVVIPVLYAWDAAGGVLSGFPYSMLGGAECNMTVADVDGDAEMDILFTSNMMSSGDSLGYVYAVHNDGQPVAGFPLRPWGFTYLNGPNVADIDGDDSLDIIGVSEYAGRLDVSVWEAGVPFTRSSWEWPTYQFDMCRTGLYRPYLSGVAEGRPVSGYEPAPASIVRGVLFLEGDCPRTGTVPKALLDISGRKVLDLQPGANDVSRLAPGVYFVRTANDEWRFVNSRVIITR